MKKWSAFLLALIMLFSLASGALAADEEEPARVLLSVCSGAVSERDMDRTAGAIEKELSKAFPGFEIRRALLDQEVIGERIARGEEAESLTDALDRLAGEGVKELLVQPTLLTEGEEYEALKKTLEAYAGYFDTVRLGKPLLRDEESAASLGEALSSALKRYIRRDTLLVLVGGAQDAQDAYGFLQAAMGDNVLAVSAAGEGAFDKAKEAIEAAGFKKLVLIPLTMEAGLLGNEVLGGAGEESWRKLLQAEGYQVEWSTYGLAQYAGVRGLLVDLAGEAETIAIPEGWEPIARAPEEAAEELAEAAEEPVEAAEELVEAAEEPEEAAEEPEEAAEEPAEAAEEPEEAAEEPAEAAEEPEEAAEEPEEAAEEPEEAAEEPEEAAEEPEEAAGEPGENAVETAEAAEEPEKAAEEPEEAAEEPEEAAEESEEPAEAEENKDFGEPVEPAALAEGEYEVEVLSGSSLFRVENAVLTVEDGEMRVKMTMANKVYGELFLGRAAEAEGAGEEDVIPFETDEDGRFTFTVPVKALNEEILLSAWSIRLERWVDRLLIVSADSLPTKAVEG